MAIDTMANKPPKGGNRFSGWLGDTLLKVTGWKIEGKLPQEPKFVIAVAPHTSNWDFFLGVAVLFSLRIKIRFLGKHSIFVPVVKQLLEFIGGMPVDRRSKHGVVAQVVEEFDANEKMILAVAPEGTRSQVFPWKTGFLAIAHKADVPVVLIGFDFVDKKVLIGPNFKSSGDFQQDMTTVYGYYKNVPAKYPDKVVFPAE
ncbi:1-acyl-sn-glycerol-3-phosphate acyltransferase [Alteromonas sp. W364]|uniref:1-acyl-sn-glycerol-3-phosphate acyltransferase n=1 Tax=Alteromonas sp. W364 TaxID=3075610 RepID=UPI002884B151|nr:1-acyl-sn-glycerol-3-phosphate acyltransferase [Alteromonas sp. W364]MDT0627985.1 1-acyl-sn-glycerol-3-phosphate acyltransferase [Alteromonas sp. W364]